MAGLVARYPIAGYVRTCTATVLLYRIWLHRVCTCTCIGTRGAGSLSPPSVHRSQVAGFFLVAGRWFPPPPSGRRCQVFRRGLWGGRLCATKVAGCRSKGIWQVSSALTEGEGPGALVLERLGGKQKKNCQCEMQWWSSSPVPWCSFGGTRGSQQCEYQSKMGRPTRRDGNHVGGNKYS